MTIKFTGGSDDIIEVEGCEGADEFTSYEDGPVMWHGDLVAPGGTDVMRVTALFDFKQSGCWSFAVGQALEEVPLPDWPIQIRQHPEVEYSVLLEVDAPAGTRLTNIWPPAKGEHG